jgi:hypothetical protein
MTPNQALQRTDMTMQTELSRSAALYERCQQIVAVAVLDEKCSCNSR